MSYRRHQTAVTQWRFDTAFHTGYAAKQPRGGDQAASSKDLPEAVLTSQEQEFMNDVARIAEDHTRGDSPAGHKEGIPIEKEATQCQEEA